MPRVELTMRCEVKDPSTVIDLRDDSLGCRGRLRATRGCVGVGLKLVSDFGDLAPDMRQSRARRGHERNEWLRTTQAPQTEERQHSPRRRERRSATGGERSSVRSDWQRGDRHAVQSAVRAR